jgi:hypothetical protein
MGSVGAGTMTQANDSGVNRMDVRDSYDSAAEAYAQHLASELTGKPLDRHLLNRFAEDLRGRGLVAGWPTSAAVPGTSRAICTTRA